MGTQSCNRMFDGGKDNVFALSCLLKLSRKVSNVFIYLTYTISHAGKSKAAQGPTLGLSVHVVCESA